MIRLVAIFLAWSGLRAIYSFTLGQSDPAYRLALEVGTRIPVHFLNLIYGLLAIAAAVSLWRRRRKGFRLAAVALALYTASTLFGLAQIRNHPEAARQAYAASREARGLPIRPERLDEMFSESGQRAVTVIGLAMCIIPFGLLLWRRKELQN